MQKSINRRDALTGAGAVAGASLVALPAMASGDPDAELKALCKELEAATAKCERASEVSYRILDEVEKALPPEPPHPHEWKRPERPADLARTYRAALGNICVKDFWENHWNPEPVRKWFADVEEEKARVKATWEEWRDARDKLYEERGFNAADDEYDKHYEKCSAIGKRIFATPARTLDGVAAKLRAGELLYLDEPDEEPGTSIVADIKRLSGGAA